MALVEGWRLSPGEEFTYVPASPSLIALRRHARIFLTLLSLALAACAGKTGAPATSGQTAPTAATPKAADTLSIGTGAVSGVYYPTGGGICRMVTERRGQHGMNCTIASTAGSIANIEGLRSGKFDVVIVQSDVQFEVYEGAGPFAQAGPDPDLRAVFSLHAEPFTVVARADSGIATSADLRGKRVNIGAPGSGARATTEAFMAANRWTMADLAEASALPLDEQAAALAAGRVDAIVFTVGHPAGEIYEATKKTTARLVPVAGPGVNRLLADHPYFAKATIPGGLYRGNDRPTPTFGVRATVITTAEMPDDVVYLVVKSVFENFEEFKSLHVALAQLDPREMAHAGLTAPLHPGAERYYREAGLM
jgi:TRAP transporter TAXI family solute receptor